MYTVHWQAEARGSAFELHAHRSAPLTPASEVAALQAVPQCGAAGKRPSGCSPLTCTALTGSESSKVTATGPGRMADTKRSTAHAQFSQPPSAARRLHRAFWSAAALALGIKHHI